MRVKLLFCWIMSFALLTGCATGGDIPTSLMQPCAELKKLDGMTGKELIKNIVSNAQVYHNCADGKAALIEAVKIRDGQ